MINEESMSDIKNPLFNIIDEVLKKSEATLASSFANQNQDKENGDEDKSSSLIQIDEIQV